MSPRKPRNKSLPLPLTDDGCKQSGVEDGGMRLDDTPSTRGEPTPTREEPKGTSLGSKLRKTLGDNLNTAAYPVDSSPNERKGQEAGIPTSDSPDALGVTLEALCVSPPIGLVSPPHVVVRAYAGTGKTWSMMMGVAYAFGEARWETITQRLGYAPIPSSEQRLIWSALADSRVLLDGNQDGTSANSRSVSITYCAFNKSIVTEFGEKWGWLVELLRETKVNLQFATVNSLGNTSIYRAFGRVEVTQEHTNNLISKALSRDIKQLRIVDPILVNATNRLVELAKLTLAGWDEVKGFDPARVDEDALDVLAAHYEIDLNGSRERVYSLVPRILEASLDVEGNREIDFNDQNWLPVVLNLPIAQSDIILVDEGQDLPRVRQEYARRAGRRVVLVGDCNQAIYGFAGADTEGIPRMERLLEQTQRGVVSLRLTETRRCGKAIVLEANRVVPDFRAHETNCEGLVRTIADGKLLDEVKDGDMVLCRMNGPLVSNALRLIRSGRKAVIRGRNFGKDLTKWIEKQKAADPGELIEKVELWASAESNKEQRKRNPSEAKLIGIQDRRECVIAFCEGETSISGVLAKVNKLFAGKVCPKCAQSFDEATSAECYKCKCKLVTPVGVQFSSVHRAKGLENPRVFILLAGAPMPHPAAKSAWQIKQEYHCLYIAITRSISELVWVR